eukprot:5625006-Ditylum_brightwellii.AAC.1
MENAATIDLTVRGGEHGHLILVLIGQCYLQLMWVNFAQSNNLGLNLVLLQAFMESVELENLCTTDCLQLATYQKYHNTDKALHNLFLATVNDKYTKVSKQNPVGYTHRTMFEVLHHLYGNYVHITPAILQASYAAMNQPYNPSLWIEDLFDQVNVAQDLTTANGIGYSELQLISIAYALIYQ